MISRGLLFYADFTLTRKKGGKVHFFQEALNVLNSHLFPQISKNGGVFGQLVPVQWIKLWKILK